MGQARRAEAMRPAVPGSPRQLTSERSWPGAAGCAVQDSETRSPSTPEIAHSTCGQIAAGAECTKMTPCTFDARVPFTSRVTTVHLRSSSIVFPNVDATTDSVCRALRVLL